MFFTKPAFEESKSDKDVAKEVVSEVLKLVTDFSKLHDSLGDDFVNFIKDNVFVAGGALRDAARNRDSENILKDIKDYDLYFINKEAVDTFLTKFVEGKEYLYIYNELSGCYNVGMLQFVTLVYGDAITVTSMFDFSCNKNYSYLSNKNSFLPFYINFTTFKNGTIVYNIKAANPASSFMRLQKLNKLGYTLPDGEMLALLLSVQLSPKLINAENIKKHLFGAFSSSDNSLEYIANQVMETFRNKTTMMKDLEQTNNTNDENTVPF